MVIEIAKPNLAAIQTAFTGRLYSMDMFTLYRAVSGQYSTYPSVIAGAAGLSLQNDVVTYLGALGPFGRFHYVGDVYSAIYNDQVKRDLQGVPELTDFWPGWDGFTQLLLDDAAEVGEPLKFPGMGYTLPKTEVTGLATSRDELLYYIYRGDVDTMETLLTLLTQYMPETIPVIPVTFKDLEGMFTLYGEWVKERFLGQTASKGARIMAKVILLADYRWYLLGGDLLAMVGSTFTQPAFTRGISFIATQLRQEAEAIKVTGG
jgi:hypothetical protein